MPDFNCEAQIVNPRHNGARVKVWLEPPGKLLSLPRPKIVGQLFAALQLEPETALAVRKGTLLTPDRRIWPDDELLVRIVASRG